MSQLVHPVNRTMPDNGSAAERREIVGRTVMHAIDLMLAWRERARQRRVLVSLDDCLLGDLGISRGAATHEADKPFWRR